MIGKVADQYAFFVLKDMTDEYMQSLVDSIAESLYIEARLRAKGVNVDQYITLSPEDEF